MQDCQFSSCRKKWNTAKILLLFTNLELTERTTIFPTFRIDRIIEQFTSLCSAHANTSEHPLRRRQLMLHRLLLIYIIIYLY